MRNDEDIRGPAASGHTRRRARHARRRDLVWLVTRPAPIPSAVTHRVSGALALDDTPVESAPATQLGDMVPPCVVVVERDAALAAAITDALQRLVRRDVSVNLIHRADHCVSSDAPAITVIDASEPDQGCPNGWLGLGAGVQLERALVFYVTRETSYSLAQRGAYAGIVLREWRSADDIVTLLAAALGE